MNTEDATPIDASTDTSKRFSLPQRTLIRVLGWMGGWLVWIIGRSLRWESRGVEHLEPIYRAGHRVIFTFWHGRIFSSTWYWRRRGIVVMSGYHFDAAYTTKIIERHGYRIARGSASKGGLRALAEMARCIQRGEDVAFTVDGPRGPIYEAKSGPVLLARKTGAAIFCFHIAHKKKFRFSSWDRTEVPWPFSRALILCAPPIYVPADASREVVEEKWKEMQRVLDELREEGEHWTTE